VRPFFSFTGNLQHPAQLVLDRILDGDDLVPAGVDLGQGGIERRRLAGAGGAGHEDHAVGLADGGAPAFSGVRRSPGVEREALENVGSCCLSRMPEHAILAEHRRA
jgi:hypothetical protein